MWNANKQMNYSNGSEIKVKIPYRPEFFFGPFLFNYLDEFILY